MRSRFRVKGLGFKIQENEVGKCKNDDVVEPMPGFVQKHRPSPGGEG